jgi:predicted ATPase
MTVKSLKFTEGAWQLDESNFQNKTPLDKTYTFAEGLNIIVGDNGVGKTSLINAIAARTFCEDKVTKVGWTDYKKIALRDDKKLLTHDEPNVKCYMIWDRNPVTLWNRKSLNNCMPTYFGEFGEMGKDFELFYTLSHSSQGQMSTSTLNKLSKRKIPEIPTRYKEKAKGGKPTILIDEMDKDFSIFRNKEYFSFLKSLATKFQVICVTHSYLVLKEDDAINWIEVQEGYREKLKREIFGLVSSEIIRSKKESAEQPSE